MLLQTDEFLRLAINAIHMDLVSRNESFQCLGLTFVGNSEWTQPGCMIVLEKGLHDSAREGAA
jgi:hypothetical protein